MGRLSGGPLEKTGVIAGMSGSPIYLEVKLADAIAYTFPFTTEPIARIRPIQEMIETFEKRAEPSPKTGRAALAKP